MRRWMVWTAWGVQALLLLFVAAGIPALWRAYEWVKVHPVGLEYQMTDDLNNGDALAKSTHRSAALYDIFAPAGAEPSRPGVFHAATVSSCASISPTAS